jgi:hypothetical protein
MLTPLIRENKRAGDTNAPLDNCLKKTLGRLAQCTETILMDGCMGIVSECRCVNSHLDGHLNLAHDGLTILGGKF